MTQRDDHEAWLAACEEHAERLSKWEADFIESLRDRMDSGIPLSERQAELLERIYAEKTP
jgi:hypothetical protein